MLGDIRVKTYFGPASSGNAGRAGNRHTALVGLPTKLYYRNCGYGGAVVRLAWVNEGERLWRSLLARWEA